MYDKSDSNPANGKKKSADAFLNIQVTDAAGNVHRFPKGLPLDANNNLHRSLIEAAKATPDRVFTVNATVYVNVPVEEKELIQF